jgi:hypothetical protein
MKSVKLEWCLGDISKAKELLNEAVKHYPGFPKVCCFLTEYCNLIHVYLIECLMLCVQRRL